MSESSPQRSLTPEKEAELLRELIEKYDRRIVLCHNSLRDLRAGKVKLIRMLWNIEAEMEQGHNP